MASGSCEILVFMAKVLRMCAFSVLAGTEASLFVRGKVAMKVETALTQSLWF